MSDASTTPYIAIIQDCIVSRLKAKGIAGGRIYDTQVVPLDGAKLPAVNVYPQSETSESISGNSSTFDSLLVMAVDVYARASSDGKLGSEIIAILDAIKKALRRDGVLARYARIKRSSFSTNHAIEGRDRMGGVGLTFTLGYEEEEDYDFDNPFEEMSVSIRYGGEELTRFNTTPTTEG